MSFPNLALCLWVNDATHFKTVYNLQNTFSLISFHFILTTVPEYVGASSLCTHSAGDEAGSVEYLTAPAGWLSEEIRALFAPPALASQVLTSGSSCLLGPLWGHLPRSGGRLWWASLKQPVPLQRAMTWVKRPQNSGSNISFACFTGQPPAFHLSSLHLSFPIHKPGMEMCPTGLLGTLCNSTWCMNNTYSNGLQVTVSPQPLEVPSLKVAPCLQGPRQPWDPSLWNWMDQGGCYCRGPSCPTVQLYQWLFNHTISLGPNPTPLPQGRAGWSSDIWCSGSQPKAHPVGACWSGKAWEEKEGCSA